MKMTVAEFLLMLDEVEKSGELPEWCKPGTTIELTDSFPWGYDKRPRQ